MSVDEVYASLATALRRQAEGQADADRALKGLEARVEHLLEVLVGRGILTEGHRQMSAKRAELAAREVRPKVRLRQFVDKYQVQGVDIDCASRIPLCQARCCSFTFPLSRQDLDEGGIHWEIEEPYMIRHELDGYCAHLDRAGGGCTIHGKRPATCRTYDCRKDSRVWLDFENRVPAPMPVGLMPLQPNPPEPDPA